MRDCCQNEALEPNSARSSGSVRRESKIGFAAGLIGRVRKDSPAMLDISTGFILAETGEN